MTDTTTDETSLDKLFPEHADEILTEIASTDNNK